MRLRGSRSIPQLIEGAGPFDDQIVDMMDTVFGAIRDGATFDFADRTLSSKLNERGMALAASGYVPPPPPMDVLYVQRKFGGMFLLGARLRARIPVADIIAPLLR